VPQKQEDILLLDFYICKTILRSFECVVKILIIPPWYPNEDTPISGIFFLEQARSLSKTGHEVRVLVPPGFGYFEKLKLFKLNFINLSYSPYEGLLTTRIKLRNPGPARDLLSRIIFYSYVQFRLGKLINYKPDIIHSHGIFHSGALAAYFRTKLKIPVILTEHNSAFVRNERLVHFQKKYIYEIFTNIDKILVVGDTLKEVFKKIVPNREIDVVGNSVDTSFFSLPTKAKSAQDFYFSALGRLEENKGIDLIIRAFAKAFREQDHIHLLVGGNGALEKQLKDLVIECGINDRVKFLGALKRLEVRDLLWRANVHVSGSYFETFGLNMIEALSCGVPVIATNSGGPKMYIHSKNGIIVPKGSVEELSKAMLDIYRNYDLYDPSNIREDCKNKYDENIFNKYLISLYNSLFNI
jgi:glycosyltransferase involved in cell wall biosynthesis